MFAPNDIIKTYFSGLNTNFNTTLSQSQYQDLKQTHVSIHLTRCDPGSITSPLIDMITTYIPITRNRNHPLLPNERIFKKDVVNLGLFFCFWPWSWNYSGRWTRSFSLFRKFPWGLTSKPPAWIASLEAQRENECEAGIERFRWDGWMLIIFALGRYRTGCGVVCFSFGSFVGRHMGMWPYTAIVIN